MNNIFFLGYGRNETRLINELEKRNCQVKSKSEMISITDVRNCDLIISFGYKHIFTPKFINECCCPIINLHISYLPFNRGAHPNFWAFYDETQSGVTIHLVDEGIDTGPILFQKKINFLDEKTFSETYKRLLLEIENLFINNINNIINKNWIEKKQISKGTFHSAKELPKNFRGWDSNIVEEVNRLKNLR